MALRIGFIGTGGIAGQHIAALSGMGDAVRLSAFCDVDESRTVVCPIRRGSVTFHHSKTPHMTTANTSNRWRKAVTNHLQWEHAGGEGGHYPWKVYVNQRTGETLVPVRS